jgi:hypothetical protein
LFDLDQSITVAALDIFLPGNQEVTALVSFGAVFLKKFPRLLPTIWMSIFRYGVATSGQVTHV